MPGPSLHLYGLSSIYFNQFDCQGYYIVMKKLSGNELVS